MTISLCLDAVSFERIPLGIFQGGNANGPWTLDSYKKIPAGFLGEIIEDISGGSSLISRGNSGKKELLKKSHETSLRNSQLNLREKTPTNIYAKSCKISKGALGEIPEGILGECPDKITGKILR